MLCGGIDSPCFCLRGNTIRHVDLMPGEDSWNWRICVQCSLCSLVPNIGDFRVITHNERNFEADQKSRLSHGSPQLWLVNGYLYNILKIRTGSESVLRTSLFVFANARWCICSRTDSTIFQKYFENMFEIWDSSKSEHTFRRSAFSSAHWYLQIFSNLKWLGKLSSRLVSTCFFETQHIFETASLTYYFEIFWNLEIRHNPSVQFQSQDFYLHMKCL